MEPKELLGILKIANNLKINTRHCYTVDNRKESVADHSWRVSLMALLLKNEEEFKSVDMDKVIHMCLIHDLGEAFTGDIPTFLKSKENEDKEDNLYFKWVENFSEPNKSYWQSLLEEMIALETQEAKIYKCLDKLEAVISHNESDIKTWLDLEYDLQLTYGSNDVKFSPYFIKLKEEIDKWTIEKIKTEKPDRV